MNALPANPSTDADDAPALPWLYRSEGFAEDLYESDDDTGHGSDPLAGGRALVLATLLVGACMLVALI
jgi:hypothetical protein